MTPPEVSPVRDSTGTLSRKYRYRPGSSACILFSVSGLRSGGVLVLEALLRDSLPSWILTRDSYGQRTDAADSGLPSSRRPPRRLPGVLSGSTGTSLRKNASENASWISWPPILARISIMPSAQEQALTASQSTGFGHRGRDTRSWRTRRKPVG